MDINRYYLIIIFICVCYIIYEYNIKIDKITLKWKNKLIKYINNNLSDKNSNLFIIISPELGDNIIMNGAIRYYCTLYNKVILTCKNIYYNQISYMYRDLNNILIYKLPDIYFIQYINYYFPIDDEINNLYSKYNITYVNLLNICNNNKINFIYNNIFINNVTRHYNILDLDENIAYNYFKIVRDYNRENILYNKLINIVGNKYVIIIDDEKRNFLINDSYTKDINLPIFKISNNSNNKDSRLNEVKSQYIFDYIKILENAHLILSIDTSMPWIVNFLNLKVNMRIYPARYDNIIYKNKNIQKLNVYTQDIIKSNINFDNYFLKYPYEILLSHINLMFSTNQNI